MYLNQEETDMYEGKHGTGVASAMKLLVAIGNAFDAERMVSINKAHISLSNQEGDLWFVSKLVEEGATCKVNATVNPAFNKKFFEDVSEISLEENIILTNTMNAYKKIGVIPTFQCTPYFENNVPAFKENVAFAASGASCFVNSVCGARTNRESSQSALCAAITGVTPLYGFLLEKNRKGEILVEVEAKMQSDYDYQLLGFCVPKKIGNRIPVFDGIHKTPSPEALMNLSTQLNVHGIFPMFHIVGVTPEAATLDESFHGKKPDWKVVITEEDILKAEQQVGAAKGAIDFVVLGCPHMTMRQIRVIAQMLKGKKVKAELWIFTSHLNKELSERMGLTEIINVAGGQIVEDSCVDQPIWAHLKGKKGLTESPKCAYYVAKRDMKLGVKSLEECINAAIWGEAK